MVTDISKIKLIERTCKCGCGGKFKVMPKSKLKFASKECFYFHYEIKKREPVPPSYPPKSKKYRPFKKWYE